MKANEAPETYPTQFRDKIDEYLWKEHQILGSCCSSVEEMKYSVAREVAEKLTDFFIKRALKWYCLDCECNDNCKDTKCFFYRQYERYLNGKENCLPPKFSDVILNEDGSTSDNWRHRHFISKMQDAFIDEVCEWIKKNVTYIHPRKETEECIVNISKLKEDLKQAMKDE